MLSRKPISTTKFLTGFTLVELMIVIVIFSLLIGGIFGIMTMSNISWSSGSTQVEVQQETRKGMDKMVRELRESNSGKVNITGGGTIITFQVPADWDTDGSWNDTNGNGWRDEDEYIWDLTDNGGNIEWGAPLHLQCKNPRCETQSSQNQYDSCHYLNYQIRYLLSGGQLLRRVLNGAGSQVKEDVLANNIASSNPPPNALMFTGSPASSPTVISIELTAEKNTTQGETMQSTLNSQVTLRN